MENIEISLFDQARDHTQPARASKRVFQVYGCVVTCQDMVKHKDPTKVFDNVSYGFVSSHFF
jgi:alpha-aminoadipic semialdehyde synthase